MQTVAPIYYQSVPPGAYMPTVSAVAAVPVGQGGYHYPQPQPFPTAQPPKNEWLKTGLTIGDMGTNLVIGTNAAGKLLGKAAGPLGVAATGAFSAVGAAMTASEERVELLEQYRDIVAGQLGISPQRVTLDSLYSAADTYAENKALKQALEAIDGKEAKSPVKTVCSTTAALAGGAVGGLTGLVTGGPLGVVTGMAGSVAASTAADAAFDAIAGSDASPTGYAEIKKMEEKLKAGEQLSAHDVFSFHAALENPLCDQIEERMGGKFHELGENTQARCMLRHHPELTDLCRYEAYAINTGKVSPRDMLRGDVQQTLTQCFDSAMELPTLSRPNCRVQTQGCSVAPMMQPHVAAMPPSIPVIGPHTQGLYQQAQAATYQPQLGSAN